MESAVLLTYKNATLRANELALLKPGAWLNDQCLLFWLENLPFNESATFVDPCAVAYLQYSYQDSSSEEDIRDMYGPLHLESKDLIFFPVNDNTDKYKAAGGSHWSLLVFARPHWLYLDSASSGVSAAA